jgi:Calcineurin-like phosphoesterase/Iron/zinc purple acid phosphatase-like protein C
MMVLCKSYLLIFWGDRAVSISRRQFITISGLAGLGAIGAGALSLSQRSESIPALAPGKPLFRFGVLADTGTGSMQQYAVGKALFQQHQARALNMVLLAGDNIYNNGEFEKIKAYFATPYEALLKSGVKFYATLGNHDARADVCGNERGEHCAATSNQPIRNEQVTYPPFNMGGQRYYTFKQGDLQFFATETNSLGNPNSPTRDAQLQWLDRELGQSKAKVKVVFGHHPLYSVGRYGNNATLIKDVQPLLEKHKVNLWIDGHDHNYQRSKPINGVTYVVAGGGGAGLYKIESQPDWSAYAKSVHSFATIDVYADRLIVTGIDSQGTVLDRGTVKL